jgi:hypothetical protein
MTATFPLESGSRCAGDAPVELSVLIAFEIEPVDETVKD